MSSDPAVSARHVSKVFHLGLSGRSDTLLKTLERRLRHPVKGRHHRESFHALDDVSFDVAAGEAVGIIGRNGAGKSTLLKILSRITPPSDGYIDVVGTVGSLLEVGTGFHPELTGIENVYLNGTILGMRKAEIDRRLPEIIDFAEVDMFLETPVKRYSSGMRVRLAFAVAAHLDPEILVVDEVLSVGDAAFQTKCLAKMKSIATDNGRTVLYVSHNLVTLEHLCSRTILLADGRLVFDGDTEPALAKYLSALPQSGIGAANGVFDLAAAARPDHHGGTQVFKRLDLRPAGGEPSNAVRTADRLQIDIVVEGLDAEPGANVAVVVGSLTSQCLFRMTSRMQPLGAAHERCPTERITIDIPRLPLAPGDYHLDVSVHSKDMSLLDEVLHAAEFTVVPADVFGTGYRFRPKDGHFVVPWDWELRPALAGADTSQV